MARDFNGTSDWISYPISYDFTSGPLSIFLWSQIESTTGTRTFLRIYDSGGATAIRLAQQGTDPASYLNAVLTTSSTALRVDTTVGTIAASSTIWRHIGFTWSGASLAETTVKVYIDGVDDSNYADPESVNGSGTVVAADTSMSFMARNTPSEFVNGRGTELAIWNRELSAGEISALYNRRLSPEFYRNGLKFYAPIVRNADDKFGGAATLDGTTVVEHPRIIYPSRRKIFIPSAVVAGGSILPAMLQQGLFVGSHL